MNWQCSTLEILPYAMMQYDDELVCLHIEMKTKFQGLGYKLLCPGTLCV